jgi:hypothetical protein
MGNGTCAFDSCHRPVWSRGYCTGHLTQQRRTGTMRPIGKRTPPGTPLDVRFWDKVEKSTDGCWEWRGADTRGYGVIEDKGVQQKAHRVSLEWSLGRPLHAGMLALHHCDNPACVRPDHLYEGTQQDNVDDRERRGRHPHSRTPARNGENDE